jgi:hypothetical protein
VDAPLVQIRVADAIAVILSIAFEVGEHITGLLPETTQVSMSAVGQPTEIGLAERFIRTLKEEHIDYTKYQDFDLF